jgi:hypothetical protein
VPRRRMRMSAQQRVGLAGGPVASVRNGASFEAAKGCPVCSTCADESLQPATGWPRRQEGSSTRYDVVQGQRGTRSREWGTDLLRPRLGCWPRCCGGRLSVDSRVLAGAGRWIDRPSLYDNNVKRASVACRPTGLWAAGHASLPSLSVA